MASSDQTMHVELKRGSGEPRAITGKLSLNTAPDTVTAAIAEKAQLPDKHFKSAAARAASIAQLAKTTNHGGSRGSDKSVPGKLPHGLTIRQEHFCQNVMAGMTHAQAYRDAYNATNIKPATIYSRAYNVAANPRVVRRMQALWEQREGRLSHTPAQLRLFVQERLMIEALSAENPASVRVRAVELIGKIGRVRLFETEGDKPQDNQSLEQILARIAPLIELGRQAQAQAQRIESPIKTR